jgi:SAM-dependent methyltransferase
MADYLDIWDSLIATDVRNIEPYPGYWEDSEGDAFRAVEPMKRALRRRLLDVGCGNGRLIPRFANYFAEVVAIDPDRDRVERARALAAASGVKNVTFMACSFADAAPSIGKFDMVLCSHVIQHLSTEECQALVRGVNSVLDDTSIVVLLTTHSKSTGDVSALWRFDSDRQRLVPEKLRNSDELDRYLAGAPSPDVIPSRSFSIRSVERLMYPWRIEAIRVFHATYPFNILDRVAFRDCLINLAPVRRYFGSDLLVVGRKG